MNQKEELELKECVESFNKLFILYKNQIPHKYAYPLNNWDCTRKILVSITKKYNRFTIDPIRESEDFMKAVNAYHRHMELEEIIRILLVGMSQTHGIEYKELNEFLTLEILRNL